MSNPRVRTDDPFLKDYQPSELRIASEFLSTWLPFLSRDLCDHCAQSLSDRVRSLDPLLDAGAEPERSDENLNALTSNNIVNKEDEDFYHSSKKNKEDEDNCDTNSLGSWKDGSDGLSEHLPEPSTSELAPETPAPRISWADMAQEEDELEEDEDRESTSKRLVNVNASTGVLTISKVVEKPTLPREQREYIRFTNVERKKDFICLERVKGKLVNIVDGLELHSGVFSTKEQTRIVDYIYELQEMGQKGQLKEQTYSAPKKWMRGKGRVTIQFGCCYNYAMDKNGNPPGILQDGSVDPLPHLFKVIVRRLVRWHVLPPTCVPDSCIVNIYEEDDCIPPHIDNHDFVRPFCTVSFLSECHIVFGSNLKIVGPGQFDGPMPIPLPVGSVLVLNGNGADVAMHCVPAVPTKRISITFRRMDESKKPRGYVPEPDLLGIQPLSYEGDRIKKLNSPKSECHMRKQPVRRAGNMETRGFSERSDTYTEPSNSNWSRRGPANRQRGRANPGR